MLIATDKYEQPQIVVLTDKIAAGGESELFLIQNMRDTVAKRFLPQYRTDKKRDKINYLIQHNPAQIGDNDVIWPTHTLWENGLFIGFLMPKAQGEKLELFCSPAPKGKNKTTFCKNIRFLNAFCWANQKLLRCGSNSAIICWLLWINCIKPSVMCWWI